MTEARFSGDRGCVQARALVVAVLVVASGIGIYLAPSSRATEDNVYLESPGGAEENPTRISVDESGAPNLIQIAVQDSSLADGFLLVEEKWLESRVPYPSIQDNEFELVQRNQLTYYRIPVSKLAEGTVVTIKNFNPEKDHRLFGYGSPDSIEFAQRPMHVLVVEEPSSGNQGRMVLDFDDGNHEGQVLRYNVAWLESHGFGDPTFLAEDGTIASARREGGSYVVEMPHFSISLIVDGIELSIDEYVNTAYVGETVPVVWHTNNGSAVSHNEIHWGSNPALLTNFLPGQAIPPGGPATCPPEAVCRSVHQNATSAAIPASGSTTTRYYAVHSIVDLTSLLTPVREVSIVVPMREPDPAVNQAPANGATNIGSSVGVSWSGNDPDGGTLSYRLYLGTQNPPTLYNNSITNTTYGVTQLSPGQTYYWRILTIDPDGLRSWGPTWSFTTSPKPDLAPFSVFSHQVNGGTRVTSFNASGSYDSDGEQLSFSWNFGDGGTGTGKTVSHTYAADGSYDVLLTVTELGLPPIYVTTSHNCVVVVLDVCIGGEQNDLGSGNDAPGENDLDPCRDGAGQLIGLDLFRGVGGTPASYDDFQNTLLATATPSDLNDCFRFFAEQSPASSAGLTSIRVLASGSSQVTYKVCNQDMVCSAAFGPGSWSFSDGMPVGEYALHASILPAAIGAQHYSFQIATYRDYDRTRDPQGYLPYGEYYAGQSYNDFEEFTTAGLKYDDPDSDTPQNFGMIDGYERAWGFNPASAADDSTDRDDDGLENRREFFYDACGVTPRNVDILVEWDYMVGEHDGLGYHEHRVPFDDLVVMFGDRLNYPRGNLTGSLILATTEDNICGGRNTIYPHTTYFDYFGTIDTYRGANLKPEHYSEWYWMIIAHRATGDPPGGLVEVMGLADIGGNKIAMLDGTHDDYGATVRMRETWVCHELGHSFGFDHPSNDNNQPADKKTCMYSAAFEYVGPTQGYGSINYGNAVACRQNSLVSAGNIEWRYVVWFNDRARNYPGDYCN